jgi:hypothetical protein
MTVDKLGWYTLQLNWTLPSIFMTVLIFLKLLWDQCQSSLEDYNSNHLEIATQHLLWCHSEQGETLVACSELESKWQGSDEKCYQLTRNSELKFLPLNLCFLVSGILKCWTASHSRFFKNSVLQQVDIAASRPIATQQSWNKQWYNSCC